MFFKDTDTSLSPHRNIVNSWVSSFYGIVDI